MISDYAPNVSSEAENFFQSDRDLELQQKRDLKKQKFKKDGNPIALPSKILDFTLVSPTIAFTGESGHVARKVDLNTGKPVLSFKGHSGPVTSVAVRQSADNLLLFTGSWDKTARKWDTLTGDLLTTFTGHADFVKRVRVFGNFLFTASADKTIRKWDTESGSSLITFQGHSRAVEDITLTFDGDFLYSASSDTTIKKWNTATGQIVMNFDGHLTSVYGLYLFEDDGTLWSVSADKTAKRWSLETGESDMTFEHDDFVKSIVVLENGKTVATGCRDELIRFWDVASEKVVRTITAHFGEVSSLAVGSSSTLWSGSLDCTLRSWPIVLTDAEEEPKDDPIEQVEEPFAAQGTELTAEEEAELAELMDD